MIIGEKKMKHLMQMPYIETRVSKSKDGKWMINKTTFTSIKPVQYFEAVMTSDGEEELSVSEELNQELEEAKAALKN
jgi:hypothetical protein